jgi:hypothetical protein
MKRIANVSDTKVAFVAFAALAAITGGGVVALVATDDSPECLKSHTQVVPSTTVVNGKAVVTTSVVVICTEYAKESPKK